MIYHETEIIIIKDNEYIFGDGSHESTQNVLELLYTCNPNRKQVFDVGTGTGIQAIFAKKWGASKVLAVDIDYNVIITARKNFLKNNVQIESQLNIYNEQIADKFDIIVANLPCHNTRDFLKLAHQNMTKDSILIISWNNQFNIHNECDLSQYEIVQHLEGIDWDAYALKEAQR